MVMFLHVAVGGVLSTAVTVELQVPTLPARSVTESTAVNGLPGAAAILEQVTLLGATVILRLPVGVQPPGSVEPLLLRLAAKEAELPTSVTEWFWQTALGLVMSGLTVSCNVPEVTVVPDPQASKAENLKYPPLRDKGTLVMVRVTVLAFWTKVPEYGATLPNRTYEFSALLGL
jgi:hypothetical protein